MDSNPLVAYPWLHLAANLVASGIWLCGAVLILTLAFKLIWPGAWRLRHWSSWVLASATLGAVVLMLAVAAISVTYGWLSQR